MKVLGATVGSMILMTSSVLWGKGVPKASLAFPVTKAAKLYCHIKQTKFGLWNLDVAAKNLEKHTIFDYLYSIHDDVSDSMKDCSTWMKAAKQRQLKALQRKR